ncbi:MAG TPA: methylamine utilization protein [Gammaproteobacteria bacterium]|nr:methylamine utilization protein [Gammaproteobacteria bacterium]
MAGQARAGTLEVAVADGEGKPIERVAVHATAIGGSPLPARAATATMDQHDERFVPHVLVVQTGTSVLFPNNDDVSHHVYSFSPAKSFELGLYKGQVHPPIAFDEPGVVVLGCNIHDGMLGYILVVDTPYFALTNEEGIAVVEGVPDGAYDAEVWTPRVRQSDLPAAQRLTIKGSVTTAEVRITGRLQPDHDHGSSSLSWKRY